MNSTRKSAGLAHSVRAMLLWHLLRVPILDRSLHIRVQRCMNGAGVADTLQALAPLRGDFHGERDDNGEPADAAGRGRGGHVLLDGRG